MVLIAITRFFTVFAFADELLEPLTVVATVDFVRGAASLDLDSTIAVAVEVELLDFSLPFFLRF